MVVASCQSTTPAPPSVSFIASVTDRTFHTASHMLGSIEMQISGEPFAQLIGRNLGGYDRFYATTDQYVDPNGGAPKNDPLGYSLAIESYEYSKQPMNNLAFESGAGLSLMFGPVLNPTGVTGDLAFSTLRDRIQQFALESGTGGAPGTNFVVVPAPSQNPFNFYGWPGLWPVFAPFRSFDPQIAPATGATRGCTLAGGYGASLVGNQLVGDYECGYSSLNLPLRDVQVESVLDAAALGFATWKQGLWAINYWQSLHDSIGNNIVAVSSADLSQVGQPNNAVVGQYVNPGDPTGTQLIDGKPGTFMGDIPLEGFQGLTMLEEMNNQAALLLGRLLTRDGVTLSGFSSTKDALSYGGQSPIRIIPSLIDVTEIKTAPSSDLALKYFPRPATFSVGDGSSKLFALAGLLGGYAQLFALTDENNANVGGLPGPLATFDGDPFPADNGLPDGEDTPHDRALGVLQFALIDLDRVHFDPADNVLVDSATLDASGSVHRAAIVTTLDAAYTIIGIRTALRAIQSRLTLYSNDTPDTIGVPTALDASEGGAALSARSLVLLRAQADFLADVLVDGGGAAANFYDLSTATRDPSPIAIQSQASAIRGLLEAYLATSDVRYRERAVLAYAALESRFYMSDARAYRTTEKGSPAADTTLTYTPLGFGTLAGALRQFWKLVGQRPGNEVLGATILQRIKRLNKLVLNGWDDANSDDKLQFPAECTGAGLQMAERALTGELSHPADGSDRDHDCVTEISVAKLPAALAGTIVLRRK